MDRTRSLAEQIMQRYPQSFTEDFEENKKALSELTLITSKQLRNNIAGYITKSMRVEEAKEEIVEEVKAE